MTTGRTEKTRSLTILSALVCLLAFAGVVFTMIFFVRRGEAIHTVSPGKVSLSIEEIKVPGQYDGNLAEGLLPGQVLEKEPAIILDESSEDAYIRVGIEYGGVLSDREGESEEEAAERLQKMQELEAGMDFLPMWRKGSDGFYYYQEIVRPGSSVSFFTQVTIPENWGNEIAEQTFSIDLTAEGIPADYFDPWSEDENGGPVIAGWYYTDGTPAVPKE